MDLKRKEVLIRWDLFCLGIAKGQPAGVVYNGIYDCKSIDIAYAAASRLLRNVKVKERISELRSQIEGEGIADSQEIQRELTTILRNEKEDRYKLPLYKDKISAATELNRMRGITDKPIQVNYLHISERFKELEEEYLNAIREGQERIPEE